MKDQTHTETIDGWLIKTGGFAKDMALRDYFAAQAMQVAWGMFEKLYDCSVDDVISLVADHAYEIADAMLEARNGSQ